MLFSQSALYSHSHTAEAYVCKLRRRVNCLWGSHYSAVIRQMASTYTPILAILLVEKKKWPKLRLWQTIRQLICSG